MSEIVLSIIEISAAVIYLTAISVIGFGIAKSVYNDYRKKVLD